MDNSYCFCRGFDDNFSGYFSSKALELDKVLTGKHIGFTLHLQRLVGMSVVTRKTFIA